MFLYPSLLSPLSSKAKLAVAAGALALGFASLLGSGSAKAAADYVLTCKPGSAMTAVAGQYVSNKDAFATINFRPGRTGSASTAPRAGECTWTDRGFRSGEPHVLHFKDHGKWVQSTCSTNGCSFRTNSTGIQKLMNNVRKGRPFVVRAYNDGHGRLIVTRFGP